MTPAALKTWRLRLGLTQAQAAKRLGIGLRTYWKWEHGVHVIPGPVPLACAAIEAGIEPVA